MPGPQGSAGAKGAVGPRGPDGRPGTTGLRGNFKCDSTVIVTLFWSKFHVRKPLRYLILSQSIVCIL